MNEGEYQFKSLVRSLLACIIKAQHEGTPLFCINIRITERRGDGEEGRGSEGREEKRCVGREERGEIAGKVWVGHLSCTGSYQCVLQLYRIYRKGLWRRKEKRKIILATAYPFSLFIHLPSSASISLHPHPLFIP